MIRQYWKKGNLTTNVKYGPTYEWTEDEIEKMVELGLMEEVTMDQIVDLVKTGFSVDGCYEVRIPIDNLVFIE